MFGMPNGRTGRADERVAVRQVPSGTSQRTRRWSRSTAASVPQGGGLHGTPERRRSGSSAACRRACRVCAANSESPVRSRRVRDRQRRAAQAGPARRARRVERSGAGGRRSNAALPQLEPPRCPGYMIVPCRLGGVKMPSRAQRAIRSRHRPRSASVAPGILGRERRCGIRARQLVGNGCVGTRVRPATSLARHRPLLDREERLAGLAIEHEQVPGLGRLRDRRHAPAVARARRRAPAAPRTS